MTKTSFKKGAKISTTILLSTILIGITFTGANITPAFADDLCGATITSSVKLTHDQNCTDITGGITIGADNVTVDLNGWNINCTSAGGYLGSCQGTGTAGVDTNGFNGATVKGPGTINGFAVGVLVNGGTEANVKNLTITGPASPGIGSNPRPAAQHAVRVTNINCPDDLSTSVNVHNNDLSNHTEGLALIGADCVNVHHNVMHDNNSDPVQCSGIVVNGSNNNKIHHNDVTRNGENLGIDAGIIVLANSNNNHIYQNDVFLNNGEGISVRSGSSGNDVDRNQITGHVVFAGDLTEYGAGSNTYDKNCFTTTNIAPAPTTAKKCPLKGVGA